MRSCSASLPADTCLSPRMTLGAYDSQLGRRNWCLGDWSWVHRVPLWPNVCSLNNWGKQLRWSSLVKELAEGGKFGSQREKGVERPRCNDLKRSNQKHVP